MKCLKCGHQNDSDAEYCENCGTNLTGKSGITTSTKVLVVVVAVLILSLGLATGMMLNKSPVNPVNNTNLSSNQSNNTGNSSQQVNSNQPQSQVSHTQRITASQAEQIAAQYTGKPITSGTNYDAAYNYWQVYYIDSYVNGRTITGYVFVDADTGSIVEWQNGVPVKIT